MSPRTRPPRQPRELGDECAIPRVDCYKVDRGIQIFSRYQGFVSAQDPTVRPETPNLFPYRFARSPKEAGRDVCRMWMIEVWGNEMDRVAQLPGFVEQAQPTTIRSEGRQMSRLKVRIEYHSSSFGTIREIDVGEGIRLTIEACMVTLDALIPQTLQPGSAGGSAIIGNTAGTAIPVTPRLSDGLILDTMLGAFICETSSTQGNQLTTNTITVRVPANQTVRTPVPPGSRFLSIYQTGVGDIATPEWLLFDAAAAPSMGQITIGADRRVEHIDRPGNAEVVSSGPPDDEDRVLTYIYSLEV